MKALRIPQKYLDQAKYLLDPRAIDHIRGMPGMRPYNDAAITIGFARQLEFIEKELDREEFPPMESAKFIPYVSEGGEWAETVTHRQITEYGKAIWITERATDIPKVGASASEASRVIGTFALGWDYTYYDLVRASFLDVNLSLEKPRICQEGIMRFHDGVAALGDASIGAKGLANSTVVTDATADLGTNADEFDDDTAINIVTGVTNVIDSVYLNTKQNHRADTVLMPLKYLAKLRQRNFGVAENSQSILDVLKTRNPGVTFDSWEALLGVGGSGKDCLMAYHKDPRVVKYHAPVIYKAFPPFQKNAFITETIAIARSGLTEIRRPMAISRADLVAFD